MGFDRFGHLFRQDHFLSVGVDDDFYRQVKLARKFKVTLVVRRHSHDRAGTVAHQNIISHPDGDMLTGNWIDRITAGENAGFLACDRLTLDV